MTSIKDSQPAIHSAAIVFDGVMLIGAGQEIAAEGEAGIGDIADVYNGQICGCTDAI
ncbi:hypothetical protein JIR23_18135 [Bradyrhizobium diazoefficiens]|nr:hypothetical protein [Bradyrhizobium diazoefficiens]QQN67510.1 hypothetical protein JIR23_18135 [Bradyrhizobium diazoefficiens]